MRGHIGYKIPRHPTPTIRLSFATFDALTYGAVTTEQHLSFLGCDALTYGAVTTEQYLSFLGFDIVTYETPTAAEYVSFLGFDAITYINTAPEAPTGVFGTGTDTGVVLTWEASRACGQAATNHTVQYKVSTDTAWTTVNTNSTLTTFTVTGLTVGELYTFRVSATNSAGTGPYSLLADTSPMPAAGSFSATMYYTEDGWSAVRRFDGYDYIEAGGIAYRTEQVAGHTAAYFFFYPSDYFFAGATYFEFVTGINDGVGVNRLTTCASTTYQETGANEASCEYSYQFQRRQPGASGLQGEWANVYTVDTGTNLSHFEPTRPRYPQEYAVTNSYSTLYYEAGVKYDHRCIVTRKSDGVKYVTYTRTVVTNHNIQ